MAASKEGWDNYSSLLKSEMRQKIPIHKKQKQTQTNKTHKKPTTNNQTKK